MILPFWNSELQVEISPCFPFGRDYCPVSVNRFYSDELKEIAGSCMDLGGEFFFMASPLTGCVGSFPRENFFRYQPDNVFHLGFLMIMGYSSQLEKAVMISLGAAGSESGLSAGITACSVWNRGIFEGSAKVVVIAADNPFYDCANYLKLLAHVMNDVKTFIGNPGQSYYAEKFGYSRFFMSWEDESPYDSAVSRVIAEFELDASREIAGGPPNEDFPPFMGAAVAMR